MITFLAFAGLALAAGGFVLFVGGKTLTRRNRRMSDQGKQFYLERGEYR